MKPNAEPQGDSLLWGKDSSVFTLKNAMRGAGLLLASLLASPVLAQDSEASNPVVLELYTAQGCASCPPADEMMVELATRDDVIALSLHVDYWDYIGWVDSFGDPANTQRQQSYARRHGHSTIYTPQVVINGMDIMEGFQVMQIMESIATQRARTPEVTLTLERSEDGMLTVIAEPAEGTAPLVAMASRRSAMPNAVSGTLSMDGADVAAEATAEATSPTIVAPRRAVETGTFSVQVIRYIPLAQVEIMGGENAGRTAHYANIVTDWQPVATWDMAAPLTLNLPIEGDDPVVVIIQEVGLGEIVSAARLR